MIKELVKDMAKYLPSMIVPAIMGLIAIPIITRLFPPADYGNYVLVITTISILTAIVGWLNTSIIRFYPAYERDKQLKEFSSTIIKLLFISIATTSFIFIGILALVKAHIPYILYKLMLIGLLLFILSANFDILQSFFRTKRQVNRYTIFSIWRSITSIGFGITLVLLFKFGIDGLLWGSIVAIAIPLPLLWKVVIEKPSLKTGIPINSISKMAKYSLPIMVGGLAAWIIAFSDRYLLAFFRNSAEVGIYSACYSIASMSILLLTNLFYLADRPIAMHIWEKEGKERSKEFVSELTRYYLMIGIPAVVGLSVLAKPVINVLVAQNYYEGYRIIPFVALGYFFLGLGNRFQLGTLFFKKTHFIMLCTIASGLLNIGLNFLLIPKYGYLAAAITTLIAYAFYLILNIAVSIRFFIWEFPFKSLGRIVSASCVMGMVVYYIGNSLTSSAIINLPIGICIGTVIYFFMLFVLGEIRHEEIRSLRELFSETIKR